MEYDPDRYRDRSSLTSVFRRESQPSQHDPITHQPDSAIHVLTSAAIIDLIAIADIKAALAAVFPDRLLAGVLRTSALKNSMTLTSSQRGSSVS
jgi:hypothetical protein